MARYVRQHIDAKRFFVTPAEEAVESASDVLYHLDEDLSFKTVADYEKYLREQGIYREKAPKIAIVGGLNDPFSGNRANIDSLIVSLQNAGMNVYPVSSYRQRLAFLREIGPDAVIHFAHGRMVMGQADAAVEWLKERNIPISRRSPCWKRRRSGKATRWGCSEDSCPRVSSYPNWTARSTPTC